MEVVYMSSLVNAKQERFAQIYAIHGGKWSNESICRESGYGSNQSSTYYFNAQVNRLLSKPQIMARIEEIRKGSVIEVTEDTVQNAIENYLVSTVFMDYTLPYKVVHGKTKQGRETQGVLLKYSQYEDMPEQFRIRVEGFDVNGNPKFISKTKAMDIWCKMKGMDKTTMSVSDLVDMLSQAGLRVASFEDGDEVNDGSIGFDNEDSSPVQTEYSEYKKNELHNIESGLIGSLKNYATTSEIHVARHGCDEEDEEDY